MHDASDALPLDVAWLHCALVDPAPDGLKSRAGIIPVHGFILLKKTIFTKVQTAGAAKRATVFMELWRAHTRP